jgi:hypothetical protein
MRAIPLIRPNHPRWVMNRDNIPPMLGVEPFGSFDVGLPPGKESRNGRTR